MTEILVWFCPQILHSHLTAAQFWLFSQLISTLKPAVGLDKLLQQNPLQISVFSSLTAQQMNLEVIMVVLIMIC